MVTLGGSELIARARRLKLVLTDCDGVLTDAGVWYTAEGELAKRFNLRDGMGMELLRGAGIQTAIITREASAAVRARSEKLKLPFHFDGLRDKAGHLPKIVEQTGVQPEELAYIGDDVNDQEIIELITEVGITACPADAVPSIQAAVHRVLPAAGGHGAFRALADWLLELRK